MSPSLPPNLLDVWGSLGLVGAGPQQVLLGRNIDHCNIRPGTARHALGLRNIRHPGGMGCWHQHCSSLCYLVSVPIEQIRAADTYDSS